ncbi:MAG TPA: succinylglutamate desuccinylase/aspartoacylase family protein [Pseudomonadales bacterium]
MTVSFHRLGLCGAGLRCAGGLALLALLALAAGCHPPAEQARAAPVEFAPLLMPVPRIAPQVTVRPPPPPPPQPVPTIRPVLMLASLPGGPPDLFIHTSGDAERASDEPPVVPDFEILGQRVAAGTFARLTWAPTETFTGNSAPSAVLVAHGTEPGPTLCLTAAIHGDELNGIETVRRVLHDLEPERLAGTVVGVPIVNLQGFHRNSRYLPDRRDLNRYFPGNPTGSAASRIAHSLFSQVIRHCSALVDLHTGSFHRTNLPQVRGDLNNEAVVKLTAGFGSTVILHSGGGEGTLRRAAVDAGIPAVTLEAGMPLQVQEAAVEHSVKAIYTLLDTFGMYNKRSLWGNPEPVYYQSRWVRADHGGILSGEVNLGRRVQPGDLLGTVTDPITNERNVIVSPYQGRVIGMALDQFVMPGYATFHIGIEAEVADATELAPEDEDAGDHADEGGDEGFDGLMEGD